MNEHPNADLMRRALDAFSKADIETLGQLIDENAVWHVPGKSIVSGVYRGHAEIFSYFGKVMELTDGTFKTELLDIAVSDERAVNIERMTASRHDRTLDITLALVVLIRDGKMFEVRDFFSDQYAWDEFWS